MGLGICPQDCRKPLWQIDLETIQVLTVERRYSIMAALLLNDSQILKDFRMDLRILLACLLLSCLAGCQSFSVSCSLSKEFGPGERVEISIKIAEIGD